MSQKVLIIVGILLAIGAAYKMLYPSSEENTENKETIIKSNQNIITTPKVSETKQGKPSIDKPAEASNIIGAPDELFKPQSRIEKRLKLKHPFSKMNINISGNATYSDSGRIVHQVYLSVSRNGSHMFEMKLSDMWKAGYTVDVLNDCLIYYEYEDFSDFLTCDTSTVGSNISATDSG